MLQSLGLTSYVLRLTSYVVNVAGGSLDDVNLSESPPLSDEDTFPKIYISDLTLTHELWKVQYDAQLGGQSSQALLREVKGEEGYAAHMAILNARGKCSLYAVPVTCQ